MGREREREGERDACRGLCDFGLVELGRTSPCVWQVSSSADDRHRIFAPLAEAFSEFGEWMDFRVVMRADSSYSSWTGPSPSCWHAQLCLQLVRLPPANPCQRLQKKK